MSAKKTDLANLMWSEKYRPKKLADVVDQKEIIKGISNLVKNRQEIPHMLFAGPAGVGKTTTALCVAMELLGDNWRDHVLELNASDERGIKMVRERVKGFTEWRGVTGEQQIKSLFKIIILDEADEMTSEAQTALRAMIEKGSEITRFILICNYLSQIIEPIQSRCVVFRFTRLSKEVVVKHLEMICEEEKVKFEEKALAQIFDATGGDMRHSINIMQAAAGMGSVSSANITAAMDPAIDASETLGFVMEAMTWVTVVTQTGWLDRFPTLKAAVLESNASWLPLVLARSSNFSNLFAFQRDNRFVRDPVEAFHQRCFIGFESDETLVYRLWDTFEDIAIWSSDYPHHDAEDAWDALHHMAELGVPARAQRKLLGDNARRLYGIEPLMVVKERIEKYEPAILPW